MFDDPDLHRAVESDAAEVRGREETDSIAIIDDIRSHIRLVPIPTGIHVVATTTLVSIRRANCVCCSSCRPREVSRGAKPCRMDTKTDLRFCEGRRRAIKCFAHAHSVSGSTQHCFAPLEPSRGQQEDQHTQFACRMETKVVVATTWLSVGIDPTYIPY